MCRFIGSDSNGGVSIWDRRTGAFPCLEFTANSHASLYSIQLTADNLMVFGAGRYGKTSAWDLRGGGTSAFQIHKEVCHPPVVEWNISSMLEQIKTLKAQSAIVPKDVHSIIFDPSCPYQLAFHLDDGWRSGYLQSQSYTCSLSSTSLVRLQQCNHFIKLKKSIVAANKFSLCGRINSWRWHSSFRFLS